MEIKSKAHDDRINSWNLYLEMTYEEYLRIARRIIKNNDFQRKRVRSSKTVYSLLKNDLIRGCIMPPLVLAFTGKEIDSIKTIDNDIMGKILREKADEILILDGLQRTYTLLDADKEMKEDNMYKSFLDKKLRVELYININKFGVLYRMLTLNTGQTPMSARHQIEMLYSDLLESETDGIKLVTEKEGSAHAEDNEFEFKNTIDGFNSYLSNSVLPLDRAEILDNIKMLETMETEDTSKDVFELFLKTYSKLYNTIREIATDEIVTQDEIDEFEISANPFGKTVGKVFSTSQSFTGFGSAVRRMIDLNIIASLEDVMEKSNRIQPGGENNREWFLSLLKKFDYIKASKKIGNSQRQFFHYFFRELFNPDSDSYLVLISAVNNGYDKYNSQVN